MDRPRAYDGLAPIAGPARTEDVEHAPDAEVGTHFVEIELVDMAGEPVSGERYRIILPDGAVREGSLNARGRARVDGLKQAGSCRVTFPGLDAEAWEKAS